MEGYSRVRRDIRSIYAWANQNLHRQNNTLRSARLRVWQQRVLRQKHVANKHGRVDPRIILYKNKTSRTFLVSRLVAMTFCNGYADELTVDHRDGNPLNNQSDNLEWVTRSDNIRRAFVSGAYSASCTPVVLSDGATKKAFPSLAAASRFLGKGNAYLRGVISKGRRQACGYKITRL